MCLISDFCTTCLKESSLPLFLCLSLLLDCNIDDFLKKKKLTCSPQQPPSDGRAVRWTSRRNESGTLKAAARQLSWNLRLFSLNTNKPQGQKQEKERKESQFFPQKLLSMSDIIPPHQAYMKILISMIKRKIDNTLVHFRPMYF